MLHLSRPLAAQLLTHLESVYPEEGCGLVAGRAEQATHIYPIENILHSQTAYEMAALPQVETILAIEAAGDDLCAIYHSHPHSPATPSETDVALAYYPESLYLIVSLQDRARPVLRGFHIVDGMVTERRLYIE
ncbi:MAG: M67 family metallopeptidase [Anaerolineae bacterium]|nr:M67 family metallopeptidase [Anaerolineae bacterium]